ncbi:MAG: hypothetical protein N3F03_07240 [Ignavibacteria bacterium]|nr:hypothetical protein [Ignavibacteria bacterium]
MRQNYSNPFNPSTTIKFELKENVFVKISIYYILGEKIKTLIRDFRKIGRYEFCFHASDFITGIYFY